MYARFLVKVRLQQEQTKPFLGKAYVKYGQCYVMAAYFTQLGAVLANKHRAHVETFCDAFLGMTGEPGKAQEFLEKAASEDVIPLVDEDGMTFAEFVDLAERVRTKFDAPAETFLFASGLKKMEPDNATVMLWEYCLQGAALGLFHVDVARDMFDRSNQRRPQEEWDQARAAGLDIPAEQTVLTYDEVEHCEDEAFMSYCRECRPEVYPALAT